MRSVLLIIPVVASCWSCDSPPERIADRYYVLAVQGRDEEFSALPIEQQFSVALVGLKYRPPFFHHFYVIADVRGASAIDAALLLLMDPKRDQEEVDMLIEVINLVVEANRSLCSPPFVSRVQALVGSLDPPLRDHARARLARGACWRSGLP